MDPPYFNIHLRLRTRATAETNPREPCFHPGPDKSVTFTPNNGGSLKKGESLKYTFPSLIGPDEDNDALFKALFPKYHHPTSSFSFSDPPSGSAGSGVGGYGAAGHELPPNQLIVTYGQSGSGKTYALTHPSQPFGLVFAVLRHHRARGRDLVLKVAEIVGQDVRDLAPGAGPQGKRERSSSVPAATALGSSVHGLLSSPLRPSRPSTPSQSYDYVASPLGPNGRGWASYTEGQVDACIDLCGNESGHDAKFDPKDKWIGQHLAIRELGMGNKHLAPGATNYKIIRALKTLLDVGSFWHAPTRQYFTLPNEHHFLCLALTNPLSAAQTKVTLSLAQDLGRMEPPVRVQPHAPPGGALFGGPAGTRARATDTRNLLDRLHLDPGLNARFTDALAAPEFDVPVATWAAYASDFNGPTRRLENTRSLVVAESERVDAPSSALTAGCDAPGIATTLDSAEHNSAERPPMDLSAEREPSEPAEETTAAPAIEDRASPAHLIPATKATEAAEPDRHAPPTNPATIAPSPLPEPTQPAAEPTEPTAVPPEALAIANTQPKSNVPFCLAIVAMVLLFVPALGYTTVRAWSRCALSPWSWLFLPWGTSANDYHWWTGLDGNGLRTCSAPSSRSTTYIKLTSTYPGARDTASGAIVGTDANRGDKALNLDVGNDLETENGLGATSSTLDTSSTFWPTTTPHCNPPANVLSTKDLGDVTVGNNDAVFGPYPAVFSPSLSSLPLVDVVDTCPIDHEDQSMSAPGSTSSDPSAVVESPEPHGPPGSRPSDPPLPSPETHGLLAPADGARQVPIQQEANTPFEAPGSSDPPAPSTESMDVIGPDGGVSDAGELEAKSLQDGHPAPAAESVTTLSAKEAGQKLLNSLMGCTPTRSIVKGAALGVGAYLAVVAVQAFGAPPADVIAADELLVSFREVAATLR